MGFAGVWLPGDVHGDGNRGRLLPRDGERPRGPGTEPYPAQTSLPFHFGGPATRCFARGRMRTCHCGNGLESFLDFSGRGDTHVRVVAAGGGRAFPRGLPRVLEQHGWRPAGTGFADTPRRRELPRRCWKKGAPRGRPSSPRPRATH